MTDWDTLRTETLAFVERRRVAKGQVGQYVYSEAVSCATLYSSAYAAMLRSLCGDLESPGEEERHSWLDYLNQHQDDDGLYRDPVIFGQGWYQDDPLWCGRAHLTCHVIVALTCLGGVASKEFRFLHQLANPDFLLQWLDERDWGERVAFTGNEIMNVGTLLQYARDFHRDRAAGRAVEAMLDWIETHRLDPETGVWGDLDVSDPIARSHAVQAAYHWWPLFFYDRRPIPHIERAIDTVLATQNPNGGFGWGVHDPGEPFNSSACEDIDSIDPLARMSQLTDYRRQDIEAALTKATDWVLRNRTDDGGFVFLVGRDFEYGHPELLGKAGQGAMFPTWFRTLSLALIAKALPEVGRTRHPWHFAECPGYQFWR